MSDSRNYRFLDDLDYLSSMSTSGLEDLIEEAFYESDVEFERLTGLLSIYGNREGVPAVNVDMAWERFESDYMGKDEFYCSDNGYAKASNGSGNGIASKKQTHRFRWGVVAAAMVAVFALAFSMPVGVSVWNAISNRAADVFLIGQHIPSSQLSEELVILHDTLNDIGVTETVAPKWLPNDFSFTDISTLILSNRTIVSAFFDGEDKGLLIQITIMNEPDKSSSDSSDDQSSQHQSNTLSLGSISESDGKLSILWAFEKSDCLISGNITIEEAFRMISSFDE